jgi:hypothetical protein
MINLQRERQARQKKSVTTAVKKGGEDIEIYREQFDAADVETGRLPPSHVRKSLTHHKK